MNLFRHMTGFQRGTFLYVISLPTRVLHVPVIIVAASILRPKRFPPEAITRFYTDEYINFLSRVTPDNARRLTFHRSRFLVGDKNPPWRASSSPRPSQLAAPSIRFLFRLICFISRTSCTSTAAAIRLMEGRLDIAIN